MNKASTTRSTPRVLAITGGKGGVGKTSLAVNLAIALSRNGSKVCLFDADTGLANINIMLGLHPAYTLEHLFTGEKSIQDIVVEGPEGIHIIPGASGFAQCVDLDVGQQQRLVTSVRALEPHYDYMLVDTAAGIAPTVLHFIAASQVAVVVVTPEPTSLTDAFSLVKVLKRRGYRRKIQVAVNMSQNSSQAEKVYRRFSQAIDKYLKIQSEYLGSVWMDESMRSAVTLQRPVALFPKNDPSARSFYRLAERIDDVFSRPGVPKLAFSAYWQKLVEAYAARRQEMQDAGPEDLSPNAGQGAKLRVVPRHEGQDSVDNVSRPQVANVYALSGQQFGASSTQDDSHGPDYADRDDVEKASEDPAADASGMGKVLTQVEKQQLEIQRQKQREAQQQKAHQEASGAEESVNLNADAEQRWIDLRIQLNRFMADPNTTPEQVITLMSSCIFGFSDRLGPALHDLLHGLLAVIEPDSLNEEQKYLLRSDFQRLGLGSAETKDEVIEVEEGKSERYDAEGFGCQQNLAQTIRGASEKVSLENLLESIKYASLVDNSKD
ncbi:MAG: hypothetical protein C9356_09710 [Oleiphilus sp.]|nr:MAG: hypothetical protein C9356_09710 [Oleiphilus sp.]